MPYYVERRDGAVVGLYANAQPGYAEEWLKDGDEEVMSYLNPVPERKGDDTQRSTVKDEAASLAKSGDYEAAFLKVLELL